MYTTQCYHDFNYNHIMLQIYQFKMNVVNCIPGKSHWRVTENDFQLSNSLIDLF